MEVWGFFGRFGRGRVKKEEKMGEGPTYSYILATFCIRKSPRQSELRLWRLAGWGSLVEKRIRAERKIAVFGFTKLLLKQVLIAPLVEKWDENRKIAIFGLRHLPL